MQKKLTMIFGLVLVAMAGMQTASAKEHHHRYKADRVAAPAPRQFRDTNAYFPSPYVASSPDWSRYQNGALSAPAGR
jgi:hypothetical protein